MFLFFFFVFLAYTQTNKIKLDNLNKNVEKCFLYFLKLR